MLTKLFLICIIIFMDGIHSSTTEIQMLSNIMPKVAKSIGFLESIFEDFCDMYMNRHFGPKQDWKCSLLGYNRDETNVTGAHLNKTKLFLQCSCSIKYNCFDHEEFMLDSDLVDSNKFNAEKPFYTQQCVDGITELTNEVDWKCLLQTDRLETDGYYCKCKRIKVCQIDKMLEI